MTDLANDATPNLANGASGTTGSAGGGATGGDASKVQEFALNTTRDLENRAYQARDWAMGQSETVRTTVLEKPFISVGTAFATGIVFGLLLRR
jgi:ElaB/YqjD/DUF883 family membrane-anchored ribosome-binding protein